MALGEFTTLLTETFPDRTRPPFDHPPIHEYVIPDAAPRTAQA
jgi:hypothetical protein